MLGQQAQQRLRPRAGRGSCLAAACLVSVIGLWFSAYSATFAQLPSASTEVATARRQFLAAGAAGLLGAASVPEAARADLFENTQYSGGVRNNPQAARPEADVQAEIKRRGGNSLGRLIQLRGACAEAPAEGFTAQLSPGRVIVWDVDAACGEGKSFIHAAGRSNGFSPMAASDGPTRHLIKSASFDNDEIMETYKAQIGKCFDTPKGGADEISWEIASAPRGGKC